MLMDTPETGLRVGFATLLPAAVAMAAWAALLVRLVVQAQRRRATTGQAGMLGRRGLADQELAPRGFVSIAGECWQAEAEEPVRRGEAVIVTGLHGLLLRVRKEDQK